MRRLCDPPGHFRDSMVDGPFERFDHDHFFEPVDGATIMTDVFDYDPPLGLLGSVADALFLERYMRRLLAERAEAVKSAAEERPRPFQDP